MKLISALTAGSLLAAGAVVAVAVPASSAPLTTRCNGTAADVTVPGNLVVPAGGDCDLTGVTVNGSVRVLAGANLIGDGVDITGSVTSAEDGFVGLIDSEVAGRITSRQGFGVSLEGSAAGSVVSRAVEGSDIVGTTWLESDSTVAGLVDVSTGELLISSSSVGGNVVGNGTLYADVVDSTIGGTFTVTDNEDGSVFCESEVYGDATYTGNGGTLQLGADGPVEVCETASFWGGDVTLTDNTADVFVDMNIVAGDFTGDGNTGEVTLGEGNRIRGELGGQFAAPAEDAAATMRALTVVEDRQAEAEAALDARFAAAEADALKAGAAQL